MGFDRGVVQKGVRRKEKVRAVFNCIYFGLMPWWVYEGKPHYKQPYTDEKGSTSLEAESYTSHALMNLNYAKVMLTEGFVEQDLKFASKKCTYLRIGRFKIIK